MLAGQKKDFLSKDFPELLKKLNGNEKGKWGVMTAQQMVEHFADAVKNASGKLVLPQLNTGEKLEKFRGFLMSDTSFQPNTRNPLMNEEGDALRQLDMQAAIEKLQKELIYFFDIFDSKPGYQSINPFFGELDYEMNLQLLYKHALHHLSQFGLP
ncbi:MAG: hypothetical protein ABIR19_05830 [Ginsengibacter sp.]